MLGIIAGTGFYDPDFLGTAEERTIGTVYGEVYALVGEDFIFIPRHGRERNIPPHLVNHKANIAAFKVQDIEEIVAMNSVGSLKVEIPPKTIVLPHDFIQLSVIPTFFETEAVHVTPGIDVDVRKKLIHAAAKRRIKIVPRAVYFQTIGPRLETRAEINFVKDYADVIGMTMASEATLAKELGLKYASISQVDNYANGIIDEELDFSKIAEKVPCERDEIKTIVADVVKGV